MKPNPHRRKPANLEFERRSDRPRRREEESLDASEVLAPRSSRKHPLAIFFVCLGLLVTFGIISFTAEIHKCATADEPEHGVASYIIKEFNDYRFNAEDPALWQHWVGLMEPSHALKVDLDDPLLKDVLWRSSARWPWFVKTLYDTPGNDPDAFLRRERYMLIPLGMILGGLLALWSWRLSGGVAAVAATFLIAFDPNFLAHSAQIKNDVPITLAGCALAYATWRAGQHLHLWSFLLLILTSALPLVTKFSGPLQFLFLGLLLVVRAFVPLPWKCFGKELGRWYSKIALGGGLYVACGLIAYGMIWGSYSFRFAPTADGSQWSFDPVIQKTAKNEVTARHHTLDEPPEAEVQAWKPDLVTRAVMFSNEHKLFPQTYLYGFYYTYQSAIARPNFLCGVIDKIGSWKYFPCAFLFKTPIASQVAVLIGLGYMLAGGLTLMRSRLNLEAEFFWTRGWSFAALALPFAVLLIADLNSNLNLGVRHLLPVYPFIYIMAAVGIASLATKGARYGRTIVIGLAAALLLETARAFPNYISFFNAASAPWKLHLLSDSNLDWGQDLPALAKWQREHPERNLYLCYFGTVDPKYYGIRFRDLPFSMTLFEHRDDDIPMPREPGVIAISATFLQGLYMKRSGIFIYGLLREMQTPIAVLNDTIYLYNYDPTH